MLSPAAATRPARRRAQRAVRSPGQARPRRQAEGLRGPHSVSDAAADLLAGRHDDRFLLGVVVEHLGAVFLAIAAVFGAAEWQFVVRDLDRVDPGVASLELDELPFGGTKH